MKRNTHPAAPNVRREAASALQNVRRACHYMEDALTAARCDSRISLGGQRELQNILQHLNDVQGAMLVWRHKNEGPRLRAVHGNGGGESKEVESLTHSDACRFDNDSGSIPTPRR